MKTSEEKVQDIIKAANEAIERIYGDDTTEFNRRHFEVEFLKLHLESAYNSLEWKDLLYQKQADMYTKILEIKLK